jgi:very-short-patch-repair endonuclease
MTLAAERIIAELAHESLGIVTRRRLLAEGVSRSVIDHRLSVGLFEVIEPGVYRLRSAPPTDRQAVLAAVLAVPGMTAASHQTAAWLWGLVDTLEPPIHVTTERARWRAKEYTVHRSTDLYEDHITDVSGIPTTVPARLIVDLAAGTSRARTARMLDAALRGRIVSLDEVEAFIAEVARPGRPGVAVARSLVSDRLSLALTGASTLEDRFVQIIRDSGLPMPRSQYELHDELGRFIGRLDFAYPDRRFGIEIDGYRYHTDPAAFVRDRQRQNAILTAGFNLLRYTAEDLFRRPAHVIAEIAATLSWRLEVR